MTKIVPFARSKFPWEVILLITHEADASTLAVLGGVSFDILESTSKLLYRDAIEIRSLESLQKLFRAREEERKTATPSRIDTLLSLRRMKHLVLDFSSLPDLEEHHFLPNCGPLDFPSLTISPARLLTSQPFPLDTLTIKAKGTHERILHLVHTHLLPHLNPRRLEYDVQGRRTSSDGRVHDHRLYLGEIDVVPFTRLETVDYRGCIPSSRYEPPPPARYNPYQPASLPPPSLDFRRVVRFHLATLLPSDPGSLRYFLGSIIRRSMHNSERMQKGSIVLLVGTEEEKEAAEESVLGLDFGWRSPFVVELSV